jgi:3-deoxy-7-phosphoheptulonate synthase
MRTVGADDSNSLKSVDLFMSHEGLLLDYESCLTRSIDNKFFNVGTHFLWIGDRTRQCTFLTNFVVTGAHVEYFRGIENPIGVKVSSNLDPAELIRILDILNPNKEIGKITLITRYGHVKISKYLPLHINAVKKTDHKVVWCCDPMVLFS